MRTAIVVRSGRTEVRSPVSANSIVDLAQDRDPMLLDRIGGNYVRWPALYKIGHTGEVANAEANGAE